MSNSATADTAYNIKKAVLARTVPYRARRMMPGTGLSRVKAEPAPVEPAPAIPFSSVARSDRSSPQESVT